MGKKASKAEWGEEMAADALAAIKVKHDRDIRSLRSEASELRAMNKLLHERTEEQERELDAYAAALRDAPPMRPIVPRSKKRGAASESTMLALASDWHVEEVVDPREVGGKNRYSPKIADKRAETFFCRLHRVMEASRAFTKIDNLVLWLGGDFITGHIHDELVETTAMAPMEAIEFAGKLLRRGIDFLLEHSKLERIVLPCSFGNHGRDGKKPRISKAAHHNYEWFMYRRLADIYESESRVEMRVGESTLDESVVIYGKRIRFHHGESLRFSGGLQGVYGRLYKAHAEWNASMPCALTCVGHWHQAKAFQDLGLMNGSLIGYAPFAQYIKAVAEPPRQVFTLLERDRGMTLSGPVFVE